MMTYLGNLLVVSLVGAAKGVEPLTRAHALVCHRRRAAVADVHERVPEHEQHAVLLPVAPVGTALRRSTT